MDLDEYKLKYPDSEIVSENLRKKMSDNAKKYNPLKKYMDENPEKHVQTAIKNIQEFNQNKELQKLAAKKGGKKARENGHTPLKDYHENTPKHIISRNARKAIIKAIENGHTPLKDYHENTPDEIISKNAKEAYKKGLGKRLKNKPDEVRRIALENNRFRKYKLFSEKFNIDTICCSSWEVSFLGICEKICEVELLEYEPFSISYKYKNKSRKYYPDFLLNNRYLIEVKPEGLINRNPNPIKFESAKEYCRENDLIFKILTEEFLYEIDKTSKKACALFSKKCKI